MKNKNEWWEEKVLTEETVRCEFAKIRNEICKKCDIGERTTYRYNHRKKLILLCGHRFFIHDINVENLTNWFKGHPEFNHNNMTLASIARYFGGKYATMQVWRYSRPEFLKLVVSGVIAARIKGYI